MMCYMLFFANFAIMNVHKIWFWPSGTIFASTTLWTAFKLQEEQRKWMEMIDLAAEALTQTLEIHSFMIPSDPWPNCLREGQANQRWPIADHQHPYLPKHRSYHPMRQQRGMRVAQSKEEDPATFRHPDQRNQQRPLRCHSCCCFDLPGHKLHPPDSQLPALADRWVKVARPSTWSSQRCAQHQGRSPRHLPHPGPWRQFYQ